MHSASIAKDPPAVILTDDERSFQNVKTKTLSTIWAVGNPLSSIVRALDCPQKTKNTILRYKRILEYSMDLQICGRAKQVEIMQESEATDLFMCQRLKSHNTYMEDMQISL